NTVVAKLIEYVNYLTKTYPDTIPTGAVLPLVVMVSPVAPHIAEELWKKLGHGDTVTYEPFPTFEEKWLTDDEVELPVQINGKVRSRITVAADATQEQIIEVALADDKIAPQLEGKNLVKQIVIPGRMVNLVVK